MAAGDREARALVGVDAGERLEQRLEALVRHPVADGEERRLATLDRTGTGAVVTGAGVVTALSGSGQRRHHDALGGHAEIAHDVVARGRG